MNHQLVQRMRFEQRVNRQIKISEFVQSIKDEKARNVTKYQCFNKKASQLQNPIYSINFYRPKLNSSIQHDKSIEKQLSTDLIPQESLYPDNHRARKFNRSMKHIQSVLIKSREALNTTKNDSVENKTVQNSDFKPKKHYHSKMQSIEQRMKSLLKSKVSSSVNSEAVIFTHQDDRRQEIWDTFCKKKGLQKTMKPYLLKTESTSVIEKKKGKSLSQTKPKKKREQEEQEQGGMEGKLYYIQELAMRERNSVFQKKLLSRSSQFFQGVSQQLEDYSKVLENN